MAGAIERSLTYLVSPLRFEVVHCLGLISEAGKKYIEPVLYVPTHIFFAHGMKISRYVGQEVTDCIEYLLDRCSLDVFRFSLDLQGMKPGA